MKNTYDHLAARFGPALPAGPRVGILGSTSFWHHESEELCTLIGEALAGLPQISLITGGVTGVGETTGRSFFNRRVGCGQAPSIYHVLPEGYPHWDYGTTMEAGADMFERREVLGRLAHVYVVIEGGPDTEHEVEVARQNSAHFVPAARSGGHAAQLHARILVPPTIEAGLWNTLRDTAIPLGDVAAAVARLVAALSAEP